MHSTFLDNYPNLLYDSNSCPELDYLDVREYMSDILRELVNKLGNNFNDFCFLVFSTNSDGRIPDSLTQKFPGKKKVLFYLLDEAGTLANELVGNYHYIFKQYLPSENGHNMCPFPLGHVNGIWFHPNDIKPVSKRTVNAFFSGSLNKNRADFFNQFSLLKVPSTKAVTKIIRVPFIRKKGRFIKKILSKYNKKELLPDSFINITGGFKQGLSKEAYMQYLLNSKIALCPSGANSVESYRLYEAMAAGCVIVSDRLPNTSLYNGCPIIQVENWKEGIKVAQALLKDPVKLEKLQQATLQFWDDHYSPKAVADYIIKKLKVL